MAVDNFSQSRKWQVTINNPKDHNFDHSQIKNVLVDFKNLVYWCMCDEIGENGTYHTHLYLALSSAIRFSTMKKRFQGAHLELANGTSQQNRDYVRKEGDKWGKHKKKETNLAETFEEFGELPIERPGRRNDLHDLYDMIKSGLSNYDIIESNPDYMMNVDKVERVRQIIRENQYKGIFRVLDVVYVFGTTGSGKTRTVMEEFGYENVFRVTDYDHPFDSYKGQDVVIFEEFRSSLKIQDMLNFLDGYPLELPCRYANKIACFTKVFILSNLDLSGQYVSIQYEHPETWRAFLRRINSVKVYKSGVVDLYDLKKLNYHFVWGVFDEKKEALASFV